MGNGSNCACFENPPAAPVTGQSSSAGPGAGKPLSVLVAEASEEDFSRICLALNSGGFLLHLERVHAVPKMESALAGGRWDLVVCDYGLPGFDGLRALELVRQTGKDIPVIMVSSVAGEEAAVEAMLAGARDYVLKSNLARLVPALQRELAQAQERQKARERELELRRLKSGFVSLVSHEFRTPLAIINAANQMLDRYGERMSLEERNEKLSEIQEGVNRMTLLMDDVLLEEQIRMGKLVFKPEAFDLAARCRRWCDELVAAHQSRNRITLNVKDLPPEVVMDLKLVQTILSNLLSNAIKYSPPGRSVVLSVKGATAGGQPKDPSASAPQECQIVFVVEDWGSGIPEDEIPKLFDSFHRCKNVGNIPGTGLGMSIVKQCTQLHGGRIEVKSQLNAGSTFTVFLPAQIAPSIRLLPTNSAGSGVRPLSAVAGQVGQPARLSTPVK